jgi:hypothetical protein
MLWLWLSLLAVVIIAAGLIFYRIGRAADPIRRLEQARAQFQYQREELEASFFRAAALSGKPRGLRWLECQWGDAVEFALDRQSRHFVALVGVTIRFEAIAGSDMEGLPAVANLRNASAVFFFAGGRWHTQGRAVFNLNPDEALQHFAQQYERL